MKNKALPKKFEFLIKDKDESFRLYVDRSEIGKRVLASLDGKRDGVDAFGNPKEGFYLSSRNKEVGLLGQLYGLNAIFTIMNRYNVPMDDTHKQQIKDGLNYVFDYVEGNAGIYDLNPVLAEEENTEFFVDNKNDYIGALTWALSLMTSARVAERRGSLVFTPEESEKIKKQMKAIVKFFVNHVVGTEENPLGWGYTKGCTEPSLFFTYSVVEAFADFDDNILNGGDLGPDEEAINYIDDVKDTDEVIDEERFTKRYQSLCFKIGDRAWELFRDVLKTDFFSDNFSAGFKIISKEEILNSSRSSVLFNTLYVIFILFYSYTNVRNQEESEEIVSSMTLALQLIQNFYDELCAEERESIVDRHILAFDQPHSFIKDIGKVLNEESIQASPIIPMLVKANNLIALHILRFPQQQMGELFDMMLDAQMDGENNWLWDKRKYDLLSTERYLESIADFFDYYDKYERIYADKATTDAKRRKEIKSEIKPELEREIEKNLNKKHTDHIRKIKEKMGENYPIEKEINSRIQSMVEERSMGILLDAMDVIIKYNETPAKRKPQVEAEFTPQQKLLKEKFEHLMSSYMADDIRRSAQDANEMSAAVLDQAVNADIKKFVSAFVAFVARYNVNLPDDKKMSMADIFGMIVNND